jgi:hypothetical protein
MPHILIQKVTTPEYGRVVVETSDGQRYSAALASFEAVHCYPRTMDEWQRVAIDSYGLALVWTSRFEVHVDQIIGLADHKEATARAS